MDFTRRNAMTALACLMTLLGVDAASGRDTTPKTILVLGDSLSAEYGLPRGSGWVALLTQKLQAEKIDAKVINASISGETTPGGLTRLPALLSRHQPTHVVIELGANDALRGLPLAATRANLTAMVRASKQAGAQVVLVGMQVPPNYGSRYTADFLAIFDEVARKESTALVPFFLKGVADRPDARDWFQPDATHPLAKAHPILLGHVWQALLPLLLGRQRRG